MDWKFYIILLTVFSQSINAQKEDHNWLLNTWNLDYQEVESGRGASVFDFNFLPPRIYGNPDIILDFNKSNAIICDENGEILFYSNAMSVHGNNHLPVENGDTINYSPVWDVITWSWSNSGSISVGFRAPDLVGILPIPDDSTEYLLLYQNFENRSETGFSELWHSKIKREGPESWSLYNKDEILNDSISNLGKLVACTHANGRDWWLLQFDRDQVFTYLIDPNGIRLEFTQLLPITPRDVIGQAKFSPQGDRFAYYGIERRDQVGGAELFISDFDRCSGELSNVELHIFDSFHHSDIDNGLCFSPDGNMLYYASLNEVKQIDFSEDNYVESAITVLEYNGEECELPSPLTNPNQFGLMQLAPDNKIYLSNWVSCNLFNIIHHPNEKGLACMAEKDAIELPTDIYGNTPTFNTYRLGPLDGSPCDTLGIDNHPVSRFWYEQDSTDHHTVQLWDVSYFRPESWEWSFGDGNGSDERHPIHEFDSNGNYEVCLTVSNENSTHTSCQNIQVGPVSTDDPSREYDISIYPNPVEDFTRLVFHDYLPEDARIVLYDISGRKVFSTKVYQESMIDLSGLAEGAYFYEVLDVDVSLVSGKLVKM